ncbi:hypothetical protein [Xanthobacter pseudotagetidis]|uniref:hypothetical protein n=1 Tax=Xanthobacter pseudotagetidis TaxID=3119911 RepID=UPI00372AE704
MTPEAHLAKAARIERSLARLEPRDYEIRIDGAMLAANHYVNRALHILGLRSEDADIVHTEYLVAIDLTRFRLMAPKLLEALEGIERLRAPFVRGGAPGGFAAGEAALGLLAQAKAASGDVRAPDLVIADYTAARR